MEMWIDDSSLKERSHLPASIIVLGAVRPGDYFPTRSCLRAREYGGLATEVLAQEYIH